MPAPVPTMMNGRRFPSMAAAARALGVSRYAVWLAVERGQSSVGRKPGRPGMRCYVWGKVYPSLTAAAAAHGLSRQAASKARAKLRAAA